MALLADKPRVLPRRHAVLAALVGGVSAQLGAAFAAVVVLIVMGVAGGLSQVELEQLGQSPRLMLLLGPVVSLTLLATALLAPWVTRVSVREALGLKLPPAWLWLVAPLAIPGIGTIGDLLAMGLTSLAPDFTLGTGAALVEASRRESLLLLIPVLAILPGVSEELFFRGMLQRAFGNSALGVVGVSVVFALYHLDPPHVVATLPVGLYLGWLALRSNSSLLPVGVHVLNNTLAVLALRSETLSFGYGTDQAVPVAWLVGTLLLAAIAVVALWHGTRNSKR